MGLDIYLAKDPDRVGVRARMAEYETESEELYKTITDETVRNEALQKLIERLNLGKWGSSPTEVDINEPSITEPDHICRIGYLRSSYNEGGANAVFRRIGLPTFHDIFAAPDQEYIVVPDWSASRVRCVDAIEKMQAFIASPMGKFDVLQVDANPFMELHKLPSSRNAALEVFRNELERDNRSGWQSYSNALGEFYFDGMKVVAFISGTKKRVFGSGDEFCNFVIYEKEEGYGHYLNSLLIALETIDYVLAQPEAEQPHFYMRWSG